MKSTESISRFLFLAFGLTREYKLAEEGRCTLIEPDGVRICRRNIIALAGLLVLSGLAGAGPSDLDVLGIKPGGGSQGAIVVGAATFLVQVYWYYLKHCHLTEDGKVRLKDMKNNEVLLPIHSGRQIIIVQKRANLLSNRIAFALTVFSLYYIISWVVSAHTKGTAT